MALQRWWQPLSYDRWGRVLEDTAPGFQFYGFAGGHYDSLTQLTHFGMRDSDGEAGRCLSRDPVLFAARDANIYASVGNDPVNGRDPQGLWVESGLDVVSVGMDSASLGACQRNS